MPEHTAFRIDKITLEKLRLIAESQERSMAGQVRFMVDRELGSLENQGLLNSQKTNKQEQENGR